MSRHLPEMRGTVGLLLANRQTDSCGVGGMSQRRINAHMHTAHQACMHDYAGADVRMLRFFVKPTDMFNELQTSVRGSDCACDSDNDGRPQALGASDVALVDMPPVPREEPGSRVSTFSSKASQGF